MIGSLRICLRIKYSSCLRFNIFHETNSLELKKSCAQKVKKEESYFRLLNIIMLTTAKAAIVGINHG